MSSTPTKNADIFYKSPIGTARYPRTAIADTRFNEKGVYSVGLMLTPDEITAAEETMTVAFNKAFPDHRGAIKLPFKVDEDGQPYLVGKTSFKPKVVDTNREPVETVEHGARVRLVGRLRPYKSPLGGGIAFYLHACDVIDPTPESTWNKPHHGDPMPTDAELAWMQSDLPKPRGPVQ